MFNKQSTLCHQN